VYTFRNIQQNKIYVLKFLEKGENDDGDAVKGLEALKSEEDCPNIRKYYNSFSYRDYLLVFLRILD